MIPIIKEVGMHNSSFVQWQKSDEPVKPDDESDPIPVPPDKERKPPVEPPPDYPPENPDKEPIGDPQPREPVRIS